MADSIDAYEILQVDAEAEDEVIRTAYRRLARKHHPDLAVGPEMAARMAAINAAWALIGTPAARAAYDRWRSDTVDPRVPGGGHEPRAPSHATGNGASAPGADTAPGVHRSPAGTRPPAGDRPARAQPRPETVSRDWTSGRSTVGGGFDESMRIPEGLGAAGPPPGRPSGSVLNFGRYSGWSVGEIARHDIEYIEWLDRTPIGRIYREEVDGLLRAAGRRQSASTDATERRGLFRRR